MILIWGTRFSFLSSFIITVKMILQQWPHFKRPLETILAITFLFTVLLYLQLRNTSYISKHVSHGGPADIGAISNSSFGFEKIFVVGLPSRTDRRDRITLQAALTDVEYEFVDGVQGKDVSDKVIPMTSQRERLDNGALGCWRAHMNAIREIVRRNISTALILEDDADWDVRIKPQLRDFALSARTLTQPLRGAPGSYADSTFLDPAKAAAGTVPQIPFENMPATIPPKTSPYGDGWDLLWLGHCGMLFPWPGNNRLPKGRVIHKNDETVPQKQYLYSVTPPHSLVEQYPHHTRAVHHVQDGVCTLGYAISQQGARSLLLEVGLMDLERPIDILLAYFCTGDKGRSMHRCLGIQPGVFQHHRPAGPVNASSDIDNHGEGFRTKGHTDMVRWSTILNAKTLLQGGTVMWDQLPNDKEKEKENENRKN